ncbi:MAG: hypothetical protein Q9227_004194 [Pyrenula ochraceoflavens]
MAIDKTLRVRVPGLHLLPQRRSSEHFPQPTRKKQHLINPEHITNEQAFEPQNLQSNSAWEGIISSEALPGGLSFYRGPSGGGKSGLISSTDDFDLAMEDATPTQATQPYQDPRRLGQHNSGQLSEQDLSDVICILHPMTTGAHDVVKLLADNSPQHVFPNADLLGDSDIEASLVPDGQISRDVALRFSSQLKNKTMGFTFGRSITYSDIALVKDARERQLSNIHFRIFLNNDGILMLQDVSTNGTMIDNIHLKCNKSKKLTSAAGDTRMLHQGAMITVVARLSNEIKFMVKSPPRGHHLQSYIENFQRWIAFCTGQAPVPGRSGFLAASSMSENTYGMHWNGNPEYNVTGHLGKGAFATVFKIATVRDGIVYAAKELDKRRFMKNGILDLKVENEMRIMKGLRHPNIVQYIDHHEHDQWVYIIMEFVPFGELSSFVQRNGVLTEPMGQNVTRQILHALEYLHQRKITHRDIKPDNILIASHNPFLVKLSDFGLSKCIDDQETFLKTFCGTLLYCAPEVYPDYGMYVAGEARKRRRAGDPPLKTSPYDSSVDMWSFGAVLFHVLCNKPPVVGRGDDKGAQMLSNIMTKDIDVEPLNKRRISEEGVNFIMGLLNRDPTKRPTEQICFRHPWLKNVDDFVKYSQSEHDGFVQHDDELEMIEEALPPSLTSNSPEFRDNLAEDRELDETKILPERDRQEPTYQSKRQRLNHGAAKAPYAPVIAYPSLPHITPSSTPMSGNGDRLFGEIGHSAFPSSGVLGATYNSRADVPAMTEGLQRVSVDDFASAQSNDPQSSNGDFPRSSHMPTPNKQPPRTLTGSAPSLLGAEAQLDQFQMASPSINSDITSPSTTNPQTPKTREMTPVESEGLPPTEHFPDVRNSFTGHSTCREDEQIQEAVRVPSSPRRRVTRSVDISIPEGIHLELGTMPYIYNNGRPAIVPQKATTFQAFEEPTGTMAAIELAETVDAQTGRVVDKAQRENWNKENDHTTKLQGRDISRQISLPDPTPLATSGDHERNILLKPPLRLGTLTAVPGSFTDIKINLNSRLTSWGRGSANTLIHPNGNDVRVPKYALMITFWAPKIEERIDNGEDWMKIPGIRTVVSTGTSGTIYVNDVALRAQSPEGSREEGYYYGKIYTGDIITICQGPKGFLRFRVEIMYGDSARLRPPEEEGFKIQVETKYFQQGKSMRMSNGERGNQAVGQNGRRPAQPNQES